MLDVDKDLMYIDKDDIDTGKPFPSAVGIQLIFLIIIPALEAIKDEK